jgi:S1-C subfamily serine protease
MLTLLIALIGTGCSTAGLTRQATPSTTSPTPTGSPSGSAAPTAAPSQSAPPVSPLTSNFQESIREVVQKVRPAVVQITSQQVQIDQFNQPFTVPGGVGSGIIYDNQGHVLTNDHVVSGAQQFLVTLPDGRSFKDAKLIGRDPKTDLAVIQISGDNLPVAELGNSDQLQVGDWVVAIGNALGLPGGPTVTTGVVSALNRTVQEPSGRGQQSGPFLLDAIQTDAPINPGNSGGPLANLAGQVIGINTLVAGQAEPGVQAQGIGFAISMATAKPIADELVANGKVVHPYIGIGYVQMTPAIAAQLGISMQEGVLVRLVEPGSPAAQAGVQLRDVITAFDGQPLKEEAALSKALNGHKPGDTVTLTLLRDGKTMDVKVTLGETPS